MHNLIPNAFNHLIMVAINHLIMVAIPYASFNTKCVI